jgi:hypothetical protein
VKVISLFLGEPIELEEVEVHFSDNDLGRASIVRRKDGLLCIYTHWKASDELHHQLAGREENVVRWRDDKTPLAVLYEDIDPEVGFYGELEEARREAIRLLGRDASYTQA